MTELDHRELMCVAQMAATLQAASSELEYRENICLGNEHFARRAWALYRATAEAHDWKEPEDCETCRGAGEIIEAVGGESLCCHTCRGTGTKPAGLASKSEDGQ